MTTPKVFLTRRWPAEVEKLIGEEFDLTLNENDIPLGQSALRKAMETHDALLCTVTDELQESAFNGLKAQVKIISNYGVGHSHIDVEAAKSAGITVTNTPGVLDDCTADLAMTLLFMTARRAGEGEREVRSGAWSGWRPTHLIGRRITGKTLGIIGFGRIGQAVARRAHFGFGMKILVQNRSPLAPEVLAQTGAVQVKTLQDLLPACDFISLHCTGGAANKHLIDESGLALMKSSGILINTARGEVVDEAALATALNTGMIAGAGLDVFEDEPQINAALLACENAVLLPHLGSGTAETRIAMGMRALENLRAYFSENVPKDVVN